MKEISKSKKNIVNWEVVLVKLLATPLLSREALYVRSLAEAMRIDLGCLKNSKIGN